MPIADILKIATSLKVSWRSLVATDLVFKALTFCILTPLFVAFWQCLLLFNGTSVLSDVDIARFFAGPYGWCCAIALGAVWLTIVAMEQSSLLYILASKSNDQSPNVSSAVQFAFSRAPRIIAVAVRIICRTLLAMIPFLFLVGLVYYGLLTEYDINYYLNEKPVEFKFAAGIGIVLVLVLTAILIRLYSGWFLAVPLVLFTEIPGFQALSTSRSVVQGNRTRVVLWLVSWIGIVFLANLLLGALVTALGKVLLPENIGSIALVATRVGVLITLVAASSLVINLFATIAFAGVLFNGYRSLDPQADNAIANDMIPPSPESKSSFKLFTRPRIIAAALLGTLGASLLGYQTLSSLRLEDSTEVMAHRGASFVAPENTMAAFEQAIEDGADWIEIDVQEIADGTVVVAHDKDFMKLSGSPLKIWDATPSDLAKLDIGSWFAEEFSDQRMPTLADVLRLCKDRVGVNIELKYYGHDEQLEQRVVETIEAEQMVDQVVIMSLKPEGVAKTKQLRPSLRCGLLLSVYVGNMRDLEADFLAVNSKFATRKFVEQAHKLGKEVFVWTVNDAVTMSQLLNRKVDGILTDRPDLAKQVLADRSEMSSAQRLLTEVALLFNAPTNDTAQ